MRALNGDQPVWSPTDHLIADLWLLTLKVNSVKGSPASRIKDHPVRAEMQAKARSAAKAARVGGMKAMFEKRKRRYGLG